MPLPSSAVQPVLLEADERRPPESDAPASAWWCRLVQGLRGLVVPPQCPACAARIARPGRLCGGCAAQFALEAERITVELEALNVHAVAPFAGVWSRVVRAYKEDPSGGVAELVEPLFAQLLAERIGAPAPILVPVPMAPVRRRERGFSPVERLVGAASRELGWPSELRMLRRVRYRRPLRGLSAPERRAEMLGAVEPNPEASAWLGAAGAAGAGAVRVVLVDDVLTTGSTLQACAAALQTMGLPGLEIHAVVLGATPAEG